jgi:membrane protease YdiL (CAAX protease family)
MLWSPYSRYRYGWRLRRQFTIQSYPYLPYHRATLHPLPCLLFLLPLLIAYEVGIFWVGGSHAEALRNGADAWLRWALEVFGLHPLYGAPVLMAVIFLIWSWLRRDDRPDDLLGVCLGMAMESVAFGLVLWGLSQGLAPLLEVVTAPASWAGSDGLPQLVTFVGAGIYEELLFRLLLFSGLVALLRSLLAPKLVAVPVAAIVSATLFAAAHHVGPYGEPFDDYVFLFRTLAGLYFAALYQFRGFGIVVGAHACYDVLVG